MDARVNVRLTPRPVFECVRDRLDALNFELGALEKARGAVADRESGEYLRAVRRIDKWWQDNGHEFEQLRGDK